MYRTETNGKITSKTFRIRRVLRAKGRMQGEPAGRRQAHLAERRTREEQWDALEASLRK